MKTASLWCAGALFCLLQAGAGAQGRQQEVTWNNPNGPRLRGVEHRSFRSPAMAREVGYSVYLPKEYASGAARYPVIYYLHGATGNENSGAAGFAPLLDRMSSGRTIPPVIAVFPNGGMSGFEDRPGERVMVETLIVKELIPLIDRTYRTVADHKGRVITGFSMGGGGALRLGLKHPDLFSAAGSWAGAVLTQNGSQPAELDVERLRSAAGGIRLLLIVGDQDMTYGMNKMLIQRLAQAKYPAQTHVLPGVAHDLGQYYQKTGEEMVRFLAQKF